MNFLKKPEQLNNTYFIVGKEKRTPLYRKTHIFIDKITPNRVVQNKNSYKIIHLNKMYVIDGFEISTENDKVMNIRLFGFHPNCDPCTDIFCLPEFKKGVKFDSEYLNIIITNIQTYYLDNCFFNPTGKDLTYKKMKSLYISS